MMTLMHKRESISIVAVKGQRVFGIICLNDPTKDLIEKVKADDQMRLFEYSISYSEII